MIPKTNENVTIRIEQYYNKSYRMDFENKRIVGTSDGLDSVVQAVRKILSTPRYSERIYSGDYGIEINNLMGKSIPYVRANLWLAINEALMVDNRILSVTLDSLDQVAVDALRATFSVQSKYGTFSSSLSVEV